MNIKKLLFSMLFFLIIIFIATNVKATNISITPTNPKVGDTVTITVEVPNVHTVSLTADISGAISGAIRLVDGDMSGNAKTYSKSESYKCEKEGEIKVTISDKSTAVLDGKYVDVKASKSVNVEKPKPVEVPVEQPPVVTLSSDANLKMLGNKPYDFSGFKPDKLEYNVTVPKETSKINIYATKNQNGQTISGTGDKNLEVGNNTFEIKVVAEDKKTTKTYKINVTRESISKVATLSNLGINPNDFKGFKPSKLSYDVDVPFETDKVNIYAEKGNSAQTISGTGDRNLEIGKNTFEIKVTAEDGKTTKTYILNITRKAENAEETSENTNEIETESNSKGILNLEVEGYKISPEFKPDIYEYKIEAKNVIKELKVKVETDDEEQDRYDISILGNENLGIGENTVVITVIDTKTEEIKTYKINVNITEVVIDIKPLNKVMASAQANYSKQQMLLVITIEGILVLIIIFFITKLIINKHSKNESLKDEETEKNEEAEKNSQNEELDENEEDEEELPKGLLINKEKNEIEEKTIQLENTETPENSIKENLEQNGETRDEMSELEDFISRKERARNLGRRFR